jgi:hypothetical protein
VVFRGKAGYSLLIAIIAVNVFAVLIMMARSMWETELTRDLEEELIFRARQYVTAIELYKQKHTNLYPQDLDILYTEKFLRKQYPDPMTEKGEWNIVMQGTTGGKKSLLIVPPDQLDQYITQAQIIGVASSSCEEGFKEYRKKKRYCEWAIYVGEDPSKDMPEITFVGEESDERGKGGGDREGSREGGDMGRDREDRGESGDGGQQLKGEIDD